MVSVLVAVSALAAVLLGARALVDVVAGPASQLLPLVVVALAVASRAAVPFLTLQRLADRDRYGYGVLVAPALASLGWGPFVTACMLGVALGWIARRLPLSTLAQPARRPSEVALSVSRITVAAALGASVTHAPVWPDASTFAAAMVGAVVFVAVESTFADLAVALAERLPFTRVAASEVGRAVPVEAVSLACGVFVTLVVQAYTGDAAWILLAALVSLALAVTMSASEQARARYQALLRLTASAEAGTSPADVEAIVVGTIADLVHAEHGALRDQPPAGDEIGVLLRRRDRRRQWLVMGGRRGLARSFSVRDQDLLQAAGPLVARAIGDAVERAGISSLAGSDPLTGLANRRGLEQRAPALLAEDEDLGRRTVLAVLDVDQFKPVNDELGHDAGDQLLVDLGEALRSSAREHDVVARIGGDEFVLVAGGLPDAAVADGVAHRVRHEVDGLRAPDGRAVRVSLGVAVAPEDGRVLDGLLRTADRRMYEDKRAST